MSGFRSCFGKIGLAVTVGILSSTNSARCARRTTSRAIEFLISDRISKLGSLVRLSRLDELPQLYNILVGEMSFVGPRPLIVTDHEPGTQDRLLVRPGLTGWAQVNGGRKLAPEDKAALDIWYVAHLSLALDFKIVLRTLLLLFSGEHINQEAVRAAHAASSNRRCRDGCTGDRPATSQSSGYGAICGVAQACRSLMLLSRLNISD